MVNEKEEKQRREVEEKVTKIDDGRHRVLDESSDKSLTRDISKMQAPDEWPDPPEKNKR
jgi:hypothetical protein